MYATVSIVVFVSLSLCSVYLQSLESLEDATDDICPCESVTSLQEKIDEMTKQLEQHSAEASLRERLIEDLQLDVATLRVELEYMAGPNASGIHEAHSQHELAAQPSDVPFYHETTPHPPADFDLNAMTLMEIANFARGVHDDLKMLKSKQRALENEVEAMQEQMEPASGQGVDIRLEGSSTFGEGRVEVRYNGVWSTVCDDGWGYKEAEVVCNQMGFHLGGKPVAGAKYGSGRGPILLDSVQCHGNESNIVECSHDGLFMNDCSHREDVSVQCNVEGSLRLEGSSKRGTGRIEILHDGVWGTICDDAWGDDDATVVCRQLGFSTGEAVDDAYYGQGTGPMYLDEVDCDGHESRLTHCENTVFGQHNCDHTEDAGVICH